MARKIRDAGIITLVGSVACGASDASNLILNEAATASVGLVLPFDNMTFLGASIVQRVAGTGSGSFSATIAVGSGPTAVSQTSANTLVVAAATAGTYHGYVDGSGINCGAAGQQIKLTTVKTGTVSGNATLEVTLFFQP
jgi:hypothetical protein